MGKRKERINEIGQEIKALKQLRSENTECFYGTSEILNSRLISLARKLERQIVKQAKREG